MKINISGKTRKGKNVVNEQGCTFELIKIEDKVLFSSKDGPWVLLQSVKMPNKIRWVHAHSDEDFELTDKITNIF
jgi:hypothetical protein